MKKPSIFNSRFQTFTSHVADLVLLNIGAFITWGLLSAIFLPGGWFPNQDIARIVNPFGHYLLPILIAYTGGQKVYEQRGGIIGAIACIGAIAGSTYLAILGAMICGPIAGWCLKKWDEFLRPHIQQGFEMITNNLSVGIMGIFLTLATFYLLDPLVNVFNNVIASGVNFLIARDLLPLANVLIEPAKVLFLNNALNHGIFTPMGAAQVAHGGRSILFLLETNPGPGLGILAAFAMFGHGAAKKSAPGAMLIEAIGGIHEIYFPYVLMQPSLLLAATAGGVAGTFTFSVLKAGLKSAASPGSLITIFLLTPRGHGQLFAVAAGIAVATVVSFIVAAPLVHHKQQRVIKKKNALRSTAIHPVTANAKQPRQVIFAGTAEMGSPAIGAHVFRQKLTAGGAVTPHIKVISADISTLSTKPTDIIITKPNLVGLVRQQVGPDQEIIAVNNFIRNNVYHTLVVRLQREMA